MELLLWLWFYDPIFLFNLKTSLQFYKNAWILPMIIHSFLLFAGLYYLNLHESYSCNESYKLWLTVKFFISFLFLGLLVLFRFHISSFEEEEKNYFSNSIQVQPDSKAARKKSDEWIKRKTLLSPYSLIILFMSVMLIFFSFFTIGLYSYDINSRCDDKLKKVLLYHPIFILVTNSPVVIGAIIMAVGKGMPLIMNSFKKTDINKKFRNGLDYDKVSNKNMNELIKDY